jgi:hypothetical protein
MHDAKLLLISFLIAVPLHCFLISANLNLASVVTGEVSDRWRPLFVVNR